MVGMSSGIIVISPDSQSVSRSTFVYRLNGRVLINTKLAMFYIYHGENKVHFVEMMSIMSALY